MKILLSVNVRWWNAEAAYAWEKGLGLRMRGHQVTFLGLPDSPILERAAEDSFPVYPTDSLNSLSPLKWPGTVRRLRRFIREEQFDIVDAHRSEGFILLAMAARGTDAAAIRTRGDMRRPSPDPINRLAHLYLSDGLAASGMAVAERISRAFDCPPSRIEVIYYGVDAIHFAPGDGRSMRSSLKFGSQDLLVGMVGRVDRVKGLGNFLQAASIVGRRREHVKYLVAVKEDHPDLPTYLDMADKLGLSGRIAFLGYRQDIEHVYQALDILVVASLGSEANCRVTLEAMACGLPIVATRTGVIPEVVRDGVSGYLVPAGEVGPLVEALEDLVDHPDLCRRMGEAARRIVEEGFTRQVLARKAEDFYSRILRNEAAEG